MKIVVMASGRGSNFVAIEEAIRTNHIPDTTLLALICNKPDAPVIKRAEERDIPTHILRDELSIRTKLAELNFDYLVLAGYMRLLSKELVQTYPNRILNIHPSLLPLFPGLHAQKQAIVAQAKVSGCTVHIVTEEMDTGPILGQTKCEVRANDTPETLAARIQPLEHRLYIQVLKDLATRK